MQIGKDGQPEEGLSYGYRYYVTVSPKQIRQRAHVIPLEESTSSASMPKKTKRLFLKPQREYESSSSSDDDSRSDSDSESSMYNDSDETPGEENRKSKWSEDQKYKLVHSYRTRLGIVHGKFKGGSGGKRKKKEAWKEIAGKLRYLKIILM